MAANHPIVTVRRLQCFLPGLLRCHPVISLTVSPGQQERAGRTRKCLKNNSIPMFSGQQYLLHVTGDQGGLVLRDWLPLCERPCWRAGRRRVTAAPVSGDTAAGPHRSRPPQLRTRYSHPACTCPNTAPPQHPSSLNPLLHSHIPILLVRIC